MRATDHQNRECAVAANPDTFRFCFIERNRIDAFSRIAARPPAQRTGLIATSDGATVYVVDHEDDYDATQMSGKLTVLNGADKSEVALKSAGGNRLEANGVELGKGAKVVAAVTEGRKATTVHFTVR